MSHRSRSSTGAGIAAASIVVALAACAPAPTPGRSDIVLGTPNASNAGASIAANGASVVVVWAATAAGKTNAFAAASSDGGTTFATPVRVNDVNGDVRVSGEQPPRVAFADDTIVVGWASRADGRARLRAARSTDGGRTFGPSVTVHDDALSGARGWLSLAAGTHAVHAVWLDGRNAHEGAAAGGGHAAHAGGSRQDLFHARWQDGGERIETRVATNVCFCCKTSVAVAPDGALYVAWRHVYDGSIRDIAVARSTDGGGTFGAPVRVSQDGWKIDGCPEDGPSIGVSADGAVHIAWPTFVHDAAGEEGTGRKAVFYSVSTDRGATFAPRVRIDAEPGARHAAHPQIAVAGSRVALVWEALIDDRHEVRTRDIVKRERDGWAPGPQAPVTLTEDGIYPAIAAVGDGFVAAWAASSATSPGIHARRLPPPTR
ncbi:MAG: exo-alpha-sialidase [Acidobacteria bacterium]|nr:exo-alpha-sialidase [Acidobacteriota bacterium]